MPADHTNNAGVVCPRCRGRKAPVLKTVRGETETVRYRRCRLCGKRFSTREVVRGQPRPAP